MTSPLTPSIPYYCPQRFLFLSPQPFRSSFVAHSVLMNFFILGQILVSMACNRLLYISIFYFTKFGIMLMVHVLHSYDTTFSLRVFITCVLCFLLVFPLSNSIRSRNTSFTNSLRI